MGGLGALRHGWKWRGGGELHKWDFVQKNFGMGKMLLVLPAEKRDFLLNNPLILQGFFFFFEKTKQNKTNKKTQLGGDSFRHTAD